MENRGQNKAILAVVIFLSVGYVGSQITDNQQATEAKLFLNAQAQLGLVMQIPTYQAEAKQLATIVSAKLLSHSLSDEQKREAGRILDYLHAHFDI